MIISNDDSALILITLNVELYLFQAKIKNTVSRNAGAEKNFHLGGHKSIFFKNNFIRFLKSSLHLKNYSNSTFHCWKTRSPTFDCLNRKKGNFIRVNLLVENHLNSEFYCSTGLKIYSQLAYLKKALMTLASKKLKYYTCSGMKEKSSDL